MELRLKCLPLARSAGVRNFSNDKSPISDVQNGCIFSPYSASRKMKESPRHSGLWVRSAKPPLKVVVQLVTSRVMITFPLNKCIPYLHSSQVCAKLSACYACLIRVMEADS